MVDRLIKTYLNEDDDGFLVCHETSIYDLYYKDYFTISADILFHPKFKLRMEHNSINVVHCDKMIGSQITKLTKLNSVVNIRISADKPVNLSMIRFPTSLRLLEAGDNVTLCESILKFNKKYMFTKSGAIKFIDLDTQFEELQLI